MIFPPVHAASIGELATALAAFQAELPAIHKGETANVVTSKGKYSYSYASLGDISRIVEPLLGKHGLAWITLPTLNTDGRFILRYLLVHSSGEHVAGEYPLAGSTPQEIGSSITYARRYTLCSVTGVAPDDDDDGAAASRTTAARPEPAEYKPTATEVRSVIASVGKNKGMKPDEIAEEFQAWSGAHIGTTDVKLLGDYLDHLRSAEPADAPA